jgi:hypothetical protein
MNDLVRSVTDAANGLQSLSLNNLSDFKGLSTLGMIVGGLFILPFIRLFLSPLLNLSLVIWASILNISSSLVICFNEVIIVVNQYLVLFIRSFRPDRTIGKVITSRTMQTAVIWGLVFCAALLLWQESGYFTLNQNISDSSFTF